MSWLTALEFKTIYVTDSASEVKTEQIDDCLDSAKSQIVKLVDAGIITDLSATLPAKPDRVKDIRRAQGKLAYADLLLIQSSRYRSGGILLQERDMNSSATDSYESFAATENRRRVLKAEAFALIEPYYAEAEAQEIFSSHSNSENVAVRFVF